MIDTSIDLYTLQSSLKAGVEKILPGKLWVRAEISSIKPRGGGHCYIELSQSDDSGLIAKVSAVIWASKYRFIAPFFLSVTGSELKEGMKILVRVQVNYSQLYGLSLIIDDIDADFTLGEKELERRRTIERLEKEGLMEMQKELAIPVLPYNLAVVSAPDAAGYRDFIRHLNENEYGFVVRTELFQAAMQGSEAPASISRALYEAQSGGYDAILILRGGGGKVELSCYDDYELAVSIAKCPVPVFTAVGHDQDYHVCDMVAYRHLKTPTALADEILSYYMAEDERILSFQSRLRLGFENRLHNDEVKADNYIKFIFNTAAAKIAAGEAKLDFIGMKIEATDPRNVLERGFSLAVDSKGVKLSSARACSEGDKISVLFKDGRLNCKIEKIIKN